MQGTQIIAERIKEQAKSIDVSVKKLLLECEIGPNTVQKLSKGTDIVTQNLVKIADFLGCSTDYLLGRTDMPTGTYSISNSQTTINGTQANVIHNAMGSDGLTNEFMKVFAELCFDDKVSVMQYVKDIKKSAAPQDGDRK